MNEQGAIGWDCFENTVKGRGLQEGIERMYALIDLDINLFAKLNE